MLNFFLEYGPLVYFAICAFVLGSLLGSLMNVFVARLPYEKSVFWPGSRCGKCLRPVRFYDNIPLFSYWILRGRCRTCKTPFSIRYFLVELFVALAFLGILFVEVAQNINHVPGLTNAQQNLNFRFVALSNLPYFVFFLQRAILLWLLTAAALCDMEDRHIPLFITLPGVAIGLTFAACCPWPWPSFPAEVPVLKPNIDWWLANPLDVKSGLQLWPVWGPLPKWLPPGSWQLGLATGLAGAAVGTFLLRTVRFLAERGLGKEALGLGDADLMMMVGAFLGWQPVVIAFLLGGVITLILSIPSLFMRGKQPLPFGPGLAIGTAVTWLGWHIIGPLAHVLFFNKWLVFAFFSGAAAITFVLMFMFGAVQSKGEPGAPPTGEGKPPAPEAPAALAEKIP